MPSLLPDVERDSFSARGIDNMEAQYCLTSAPTWSLPIGWDMAGHARNWPISEPSSELAARMAVIGCQPWSCSQFVEACVKYD